MAKRIRPHEAAEYRPEGERVPLTPKELQREYAHLRSIAMKRIKRLEGTEFKDMQIVKKYKKRLEPASKIPPKKLKFALQDAQRFLALQTSTVRGAREARNRALSTLRAHGYEGINKENIEDFGRFMQVARASSIGRWFDSERAAMTFEEQYFNADEDEDLVDLSERAFRGWEEEQIKERARARRTRRAR